MSNGVTNFTSITLSGNLVVSGTTTITGAVTMSGNQTVSGNLTVAGTSTLTGNVTMAGTLAVTGAVTITAAGCLTSANIATGAAKRKFFISKPCPGGGVACANGTTYFDIIPVTRAGVVKAISYQTHVDPVGGVNNLSVLHNGSGGNTLLSTSNVTLNGSTADTTQTAVLTSTGSDLTFAAGDNIYVAYAAGTQTAAARDVTVVIEFEPTDY